MANVTLDFFKYQTLISAVRQVAPVPRFFVDRYAPTGAGDIFNADEVFVEYQDGDQKMAPFVAPRVGDIPVAAQGFEVAKFAPAKIAPSMMLTIDRLSQRGFGEALYEGKTPEQRAAIYQREDMAKLDARIARREEWMVAQMFKDNKITIQEYIDADTAGTSYDMKFYSTVSSDHTYTVSTQWDDTNGDFFGDVEAMCDKLADKGLPVEDLILGSATAKAVLKLTEVKDRLSKESGIITGEIRATLSQYPGVAYYGVLNVGGYMLNVFVVKEKYNNAGTMTNYFDTKAACVTAPNCAHMMYANVSQIDFGDDTFTTHSGKRIPKVFIDQNDDIRKLRLTARPLCAPRNKSPFVYAASVVQ